jgi:hypothetical protein
MHFAVCVSQLRYLLQCLHALPVIYHWLAFARLLLLLLDASSVANPVSERFRANVLCGLPMISHGEHIASLQNFIRPNIPPSRPARVVCLLCLLLVVAHRFPLQITTA